MTTPLKNRQVFLIRTFFKPPISAIKFFQVPAKPLIYCLETERASGLRHDSFSRLRHRLSGYARSPLHRRTPAGRERHGLSRGAQAPPPVRPPGRNTAVPATPGPRLLQRRRHPLSAGGAPSLSHARDQSGASANSPAGSQWHSGVHGPNALRLGALYFDQRRPPAGDHVPLYPLPELVRAAPPAWAPDPRIRALGPPPPPPTHWVYQVY